MENQKFSLERLRAQIRLHYPAFAVLSNVLDWQEDKGIGTACTNGKCVKFNPEFMGSLTKPEQLFVALHEILHIVLKHPFRKGDRDHRRFNEATDYQINWELSNGNYKGIKMPEGCLLDSRFAGLTGYEIYAILEQEAQEPQESLDSVEQFPGDEPGDDSAADGESDADSQADASTEGESGPGKSAQEKEIDRAIEQGAQIHRMGAMAGIGGGLLEKIARENSTPRIKWQSILRRFLTNQFPAFRAWRQMDRRYLAAGIPYPGMEKQSQAELVFAVDCSYSQSLKMVHDCLAETQSAINGCGLSKTHILYFTDDVESHEIYRQGQRFDFPQDIPRGGTSFQRVFDYVRENCPAAKAVVMLTDGQDYGYQKPIVPVCWIGTEQFTPPFGTFARIY